MSVRHSDLGSEVRTVVTHPTYQGSTPIFDELVREREEMAQLAEADAEEQAGDVIVEFLKRNSRWGRLKARVKGWLAW